MKTDVRICEMDLHDVVEGFYILSQAQSKVSSNGKPFLSAVLSDATGSLDAKVWDYPGPIGAGDEGKVLWIRAVVSEFKGALQLTVDRLRLADERDKYRLSDLVPAAPIDPEATLAEVKELIATLEDPDYRAVTEEMLRRHEEAFRTIPAAKSVHHGFLSGLLMHTANMLRLADFLAGLYGDTVDRSLLLAGTCLHDFGKREEFLFSELGLVTDYSMKGQLMGHLVLGAQEVGEVARELGIPEEKAVLLQHILLSHHGAPELGAAVRPLCAESELVSYIDAIDSRMEIYRETLAELEPGQFSARIFALDKKIYRHL